MILVWWAHVSIDFSIRFFIYSSSFDLYLVFKLSWYDHDWTLSLSVEFNDGDDDNDGGRCGIDLVFFYKLCNTTDEKIEMSLA